MMMKFFKLAAVVALCSLISSKPPLAPPSNAWAEGLHEKRSYGDPDEMLAGELDRLFTSIDPSSGSSIYTAFELGYPLARTIFSNGSNNLRRSLVHRSALLVSALPTYGQLYKTYGDGPLIEALDSLSPEVAKVRLALESGGSRFDGLPLPEDPKLSDYRVFPLKAGDDLQLNTGNIQQFGYLLSTIVRLGAQDTSITGDSDSNSDLKVLAQYLAHDYLRFFWLDAPAWHWSGPYHGIRARTLDRLNGGKKMEGRSFFRGFLDYDVHVMAVAADLRAAEGVDPGLVPKSELPVVRDVNAITWRVMRKRIDTGPDGNGFAFDRGIWDDNPVAQYGACMDHSLPAKPCPLKQYTTDISHAQRWPAWLESFSAAAPSIELRRKVAGWRENLAHQIGRAAYYRDDRLLLPNFLDGRDGWMLTTESVNGHNAHPPSSMTGWAMRYGFYAMLAPLDSRVARAERRFCNTISSSDPADIRFRKANYGEPEANPANGIRPETDEYGPDSPYAHICRMVVLRGLI